MYQHLHKSACKWMQWLKETVGVTKAAAETELDSAARLSIVSNAVPEESARSFVNTLVKEWAMLDRIEIF
jgi:hypothetical protein